MDDHDHTGGAIPAVGRSPEHVALLAAAHALGSTINAEDRAVYLRHVACCPAVAVRALLAMAVAAGQEHLGCAETFAELMGYARICAEHADPAALSAAVKDTGGVVRIEVVRPVPAGQS